MVALPILIGVAVLFPVGLLGLLLLVSRLEGSDLRDTTQPEQLPPWLDAAGRPEAAEPQDRPVAPPRRPPGQ